MTSKQRLLATLAALATSSALVAGCGGGADCGEGTREVDGQCVPTSVVVCGDGTTLANGVCVPDDVECPSGTTFDEASGTCVSTSTISCGEGTVEQNGVCVATGTGTGAECAAGTVEQNGNCVVSPTVCTGGTTLDATTNTCVLTEEACGEGLALANGTCVPTSEVCGDGAYFSDDTGLCLPEASCREGDVVLDGLCVPPAEALAADPSAVNIDGVLPHDFGNLADVGERLIFTGTLEDYDDEGGLLSDEDSFTFTATAGQWIKLSVQNLGAPSPAFFIEGPETFFRLSSLGIENDPARLLLLPETGEYTVYVMSGYELMSWFSLTFDFDAISSSDYRYVGTLEQIDAPTPKEITVTDDPETSESLAGANVLRLDENYFSITGADAGEYVAFSITEMHPNIIGALQIWSGDGEFLEELDAGAGDRFYRPVPESGLHILVDWLLTTVPGTAFEIETVIPDGTVVEASIADGESTQIDLTDAPANSVISVTLLDGADTLDVTVRDSAGEALGLTGTIFDGRPHFAFYSDGGDYSVELTNETGEAVEVAVLVGIILPEPMGNLSADIVTFSAATELKIQGFEFFLIEDSRAGDIVGVSYEGAEDRLLYLTLHNMFGEVVVDDEPSVDGYAYARHYNGMLGGPILVQVENAEATTTTVTMSGQRWTPVDLPEAGQPGYVAGDTIAYDSAQTLAEAGSAYLRVRIDEDVRLSGDLISVSAGDVDLYIFDEDLNYITGYFSDGDESIPVLFLRAGTYFFEISAWTELTDGFALEFDLAEFGNVIEAPGTNVGPGSATVIPSFDVTITGEATDHLNSNDEWWSFTVPATQPLALTFTVTNAGGDGIGTMIIIDSNGNDVTFNAEYVLFPGETSTVGAVFQPGQTYYVLFTGILNLISQPRDPAYPWTYVVDIAELVTSHALENEANDSFSTANALAVGSGVLGTIVGYETGFDSDFYTFDVTTAGAYSLDILSFPGADDMPEVDVYLYDADENPLVLDASMQATLEPGTYFIEVTKSGFTGDGNSYLLFVNQN